MSPLSSVKTPAENLLGVLLPCGWKVTTFVPKQPGHSGGAFSVGYIVEKGGKSAFLKALDFKKLMSARGVADPLMATRVMTESFEYERNILRECRDNHMNRVIRSISDGTVDHDDVQVPYIIFEMADGDIRKFSLQTAGFELAWVLRTFHHVLVGLNQLHRRHISHQDIKPSNILLVNGNTRKIGDFGTSVTRDCTLPHAQMTIAGDSTYATPEALYGYVDPDWVVRRCGNDMYQAGSLLVFMILDLPVTTALIHSLHQDYEPSRWSGRYEDVLPYLQEAFSKLIDNLSALLPEDYREEVLQIIKESCNPSIFLRGDPVQKRKGLNPFSMERYISRVDRMAKRAEYSLKGQK
jgi:serine/threonine protein kinase